jgi:hypothetical protein
MAGKLLLNVVEELENSHFQVCRISFSTHFLKGLYPILGVTKEEFENKMMCAGGIQGYKRDSSAYEKILLPTVECALDPKCITIDGATIANHR